MGESFGTYSIGADDELLAIVTSANIACGFHAGDPNVMRRTVERAVQHGVAVGAHPGLPDLAGFGRRMMNLSYDEVFDAVAYQIGALEAFARVAGTTLRHVKPHGALYNMAARDEHLADAIARSVHAVNPALILVGLAQSTLTRAGEQAGLRVAHEAFADRTYQADGSLTPRSQPNAIYSTSAEAAQQAVMIATQGMVCIAGSDNTVSVKADTICIHGDTPKATAFANAIRSALEHQDIIMKSLLSCLIIILVCLPARSQQVWQRAGSPPPRVSSIIATQDGILGCSTSAGPFFSIDSGNTWIYATAAPFGKFTTAVDAIASRRLFCFGTTLMRSDDNGRTWQQTALGGTPDFITAVATTTSGTVLLRLAANSVRRSTDNGTTFTTVATLTKADSTLLAQSALVVTTCTLGRYSFAATEQGVLRREEDPRRDPSFPVFVWKPVNTGLQSVLDALTVVPGSGILTNRSWRSTTKGGGNGDVWTMFGNDDTGVMRSASSFTANGTLFATSTNAVLRSSNNGDSWRFVTPMLPLNAVPYVDAKSGVALPVFVSPDKTDIVFARDTTTRLLRPSLVSTSGTDGSGWATFAVSGLPDNVSFTRLFFGKTSGNGSAPAFATDAIFNRSVLYRSTDAGRSWRGLTSVGQVPKRLAVNPVTGTIVLAGNPSLRSTNNGDTWGLSRGLPTSSDAVSVFVGTSGGVLYANVKNQGLYRSVDDGITFNRTTNGLPDEVFAIAESADRVVLALTPRGVYRSTNAGETWSAFNTGLEGIGNNEIALYPTLYPTSLSFDEAGGAWLGTTRGAYRVTRASLTDVAVKNDEPKNAQNSAVLHCVIAPNPCNDVLRVSYTLQASSAVRLELTSLRGERVALVKHSLSEAGSHEERFDITQLPAGVYWCTIQTGTAAVTRQIVVLR